MSVQLAVHAVADRRWLIEKAKNLKNHIRTPTCYYGLQKIFRFNLSQYSDSHLPDIYELIVCTYDIHILRTATISCNLVQKSSNIKGINGLGSISTSQYVVLFIWLHEIYDGPISYIYNL